MKILKIEIEIFYKKLMHMASMIFIHVVYVVCKRKLRQTDNQRNFRIY